MNDIPTNMLPIITFGDFLPGDVLLYRRLRPSENEKWISQVTDSPYAHAAIYFGANKIAEAMTPDGDDKSTRRCHVRRGNAKPVRMESGENRQTL